MSGRIYVPLFILIFLLGFGGCASRNEIIKLEEQADYLEQSNYRIEKNIAHLDSLAREQLRQMKILKADINSSFGEMDEKLDILESKSEEQKRSFYQTSSRKETAGLADTSKKEEKPDSGVKLEITLNPEKLYKSAYLDLTKGNYDLAITGFYDYLKYFPSEQSAAGAQYWIGECYYAKGDYSRAVVELRKVLEKYPDSEKIASTLYKLGLSYLGLGQNKTAQKYFQELIKKHPQSQEAKLAKEKQNKF